MIMSTDYITLKASNFIDPNCKKCFGRGFETWNKTGKNPCKCIMKNIKKAGYKPEVVKLT